MKKKILIAAAAACALTGGYAFIAPSAQAGTIPAGMTAGEFDLAGMTGEEAGEKIQTYVEEMSGQEICLMVDGNEVKTTAGELGFAWSNEAEVQEAIDRYAGGNLLDRYINMKSLEKEPVALDIETAVDSGKVAEFVENQCQSFMRPAQDAVLTRENGAFQLTDSVTGIEVDVEATKARLNEAVKGGITEPIRLEAAVTETQPARTGEQLAQIQDVLGSFSTNFSTGNASRSKNLRNGASKVNGCILMPGEEFSAYVALTPFTIENGYASAGSYANGQVVDTVGGGACQLCTTLYNAALLSEMEITQRQNHSMVVGYVKPSQDSAIAGTVKDLKFKNPYETPIYIEGGVNGGTLTFTIFGKETRPANREIKFVSETLGVTDPGAPTTRVDPSLAPGAKVRVQAAHRGLRSRLWKYVYIDGVETEKEILHTDSYMASKAIYRVGPDLPAAAQPAPAVPAEQPAQPAEPVQPAQPEQQPQPSGPAGPAGPSGDAPAA